MCLANRLGGVRAVLGTDVPGAAAAVKAVGANLLVADPQAVNLVKLKRMVIGYCRGGVRPCPKVFQKQLA